MKKIRFKDIFTFICTLSSIATSGIIICTYLTTYQLWYLGKNFDTYFTLQLGISITMFLWAVRFLLYRKGKERYIYFGICITISMIFTLFMISFVK
ncbi:hypothetical protein [Clostridium sp.]|uniref:hypothetical protein n=1 Tax=Clostridium sp. TaxID=1506 RepID=UPI003F373D65